MAQPSVQYLRNDREFAERLARHRKVWPGFCDPEFDEHWRDKKTHEVWRNWVCASSAVSVFTNSVFIATQRVDNVERDFNELITLNWISRDPLNDELYTI